MMMSEDAVQYLAEETPTSALPFMSAYKYLHIFKDSIKTKHQTITGIASA